MGYRISVDHLRESDSEVKGELHVARCYTDGSPDGHILTGAVNLSSIETRVRTAQRLAERTKTTRDFWMDLLEYTCHHTITTYRQGEEFLDLSDIEVALDQKWLVERMIPLDHIGGVIAEGGAGKGWLALALVLALDTGITLPGGLKPTRSTPCLYLDWELDHEITTRRLDWLARGLGVHRPRMFYRRMARPLYEDVGLVRRKVQAEKIGLVIIDSAIPATGGEVKETEGPLRMMRALQQIECSKFLLGHVSKATGDYTGSRRATYYGNATFNFLARNVWELRPDQKGTALYQGYFHAKYNLSPQYEQFGWQINFNQQERAASVTAFEIEKLKGLAERATNQDRIAALLLRYGGRSVKALANALDLTPEAIRTTINRNKALFVKTIVIDDDGQPVEGWGLLESRGQPGARS